MTPARLCHRAGGPARGRESPRRRRPGVGGVGALLKFPSGNQNLSRKASRCDLFPLAPGTLCHPAAYRVVADETKTAVCSNAILQFWLPRTAGHSRGTNVCERELSQRPVGTSPPNPTPPAGRRARSRVSAAPDLIQGQSSEQRPRFAFLISRVFRRESPTPPGSWAGLAM
jgi:hypothetical protein